MFEFLKKSEPKTFTIKYLREYFSKIPNINYGGCLVCAYSIYLVLKNQNAHEPFVLYALTKSGESDFNHNKAFLEGKYEEATSTSHFGWKYKNATIQDCDKDLDESDYSYVLQVMPDKIDKFAITSLSKKSEWNDMFDREHWIPIIEKDLGIKLNLKH